MSQIELIDLKRNSGDLSLTNIFVDSGEDIQEYANSASEGKMSAQDKYYNGKCGLFSINPKWLQFLNDPKLFLFSLCYFVTIQGSIATGYTSVGLSSIERRYNLTSSLAAFAVIAYEIGAILTLPISGYFGGRGHKPRILGFSLLTVGLGSLIFASPHYFSGSFSLNFNASAEICVNASTFQPECIPPLILLYPLFVIGNIIVGAGSSTLYTVGTGFIDDSTHPRFTPIHLSIFYIVVAVGPALGFALGGLFLSLFVDPFSPTTLTSEDPQWVGAWWLGFVVGGIAAVIGSLQFFFYPRRLKGSKEFDQLRQSQQPIENEGLSFEKDHNISFLTMLKEYPFYVSRILKNPTFLFASFGITAGAFLIDGIVTFLPKYVEVQFSVSPSLASYLIGGISISAASIGTMLGGLALFVFKKISVGNLALCVFILTIIEVIIPPLILIGCSSPRIAGVNFDYPNVTARTDFLVRNLNVSCLSPCDCKVNTYQPVCSGDVIYFSPCLAGCPSEIDSNGSYANCACLFQNRIALDGKCSEDCTTNLILSSIMLFFAITILFINTIPFIKLTLRSVADKDRTIALGVQSLIVRILGQLPGPLIIGAIFDLNCILWEETQCGDRGACLEYNTLTLRYSLIGVMGVGFCVSTISFFLSWISWKCKKITK